MVAEVIAPETLKTAQKGANNSRAVIGHLDHVTRSCAVIGQLGAD